MAIAADYTHRRSVFGVANPRRVGERGSGDAVNPSLEA